MTQVDQFLAALKRALKAKNVVYKDLADSLDLSESSVKRILSDKSLSLDRIEEICKACDISFSEICKNANFDEDIDSYALSKDQEKTLSENPRLLHYFILLNDGYSVSKIEKEFEISAVESKKLLFQLDKMNAIELHPKDRVKMKNKGEGVIRFRKDGAVGKALFAQTKNNYLNHEFDSDKDYIRFSNNRFKQETLNKFKKKIDKLVAEIQEEARLVDKTDKTTIDMGILLAYRPWEYSSLDAIKKK